MTKAVQATAEALAAAAEDCDGLVGLISTWSSPALLTLTPLPRP